MIDPADVLFYNKPLPECTKEELILAVLWLLENATHHDIVKEVRSRRIPKTI